MISLGKSFDWRTWFWIVSKFNISYDDSDSSEDEGMPDYKIGGYHPAHVGEVFINRYIAI